MTTTPIAISLPPRSITKFVTTESFAQAGHGSRLRLVEFDEQPRPFDGRDGRGKRKSIGRVLAELRPHLIARLEEAFGEVEGLAPI